MMLQPDACYAFIVNGMTQFVFRFVCVNHGLTIIEIPPGSGNLTNLESCGMHDDIVMV